MNLKISCDRCGEFSWKIPLKQYSLIEHDTELIRDLHEVLHNLMGPIVECVRHGRLACSETMDLLTAMTQQYLIPYALELQARELVSRAHMD